MARGASALRRVELNRAAFDAIDLAMADGLFEFAKSVIDGAGVPDADPIGLGLVQGGGVVAYIGRKRVGIYATGGQTSVKKPRAAKLQAAGITVIGGYGFPARFLEEGTVKMAAEPFLTPELMARRPDAGPFVALACLKRGITRARRIAKGDTYAARVSAATMAPVGS
jgi:hypothetical protein